MDSVYTSIDSNLQQEAINALRRGLINYDRSHGYRGPEGRVDSALIDQIIMTDTLDPETGETTSVVSVPGLCRTSTAGHPSLRPAAARSRYLGREKKRKGDRQRSE